jgi:hypothetical protein
MACIRQKIDYFVATENEDPIRCKITMHTQRTNMCCIFSGTKTDWDAVFKTIKTEPWATFHCQVYVAESIKFKFMAVHIFTFAVTHNN